MSEETSETAKEIVLKSLIKKYYSNSVKRALLYVILSEVFEEEFYEIYEDEISLSNDTAVVTILPYAISKADDIAKWVVGLDGLSCCVVNVRGIAFAEKPQTGAPRERLGEHQSGEVRDSED